MSFVSEGGAEPETEDDNDRFTEILKDEEQVNVDDMHLHRTAQELMCTHEYNERSVGDRIPKKMLVKEISAAMYPEETFQHKMFRLQRLPEM